jgi:hypothetical protein
MVKIGMFGIVHFAAGSGAVLFHRCAPADR